MYTAGQQTCYDTYSHRLLENFNFYFIHFFNEKYFLYFKTRINPAHDANEIADL